MAARNPEDVHAALEDAFNRGDLDAFVAVFEHDATATAPLDGRVVHGRDEIRAVTAPVFALQPDAHIEVVGKVQGDGLALTHASWTLTGVSPQGDPVEMSGLGTVVSRQQPDGHWLIVLETPLTPA